jgi:hypothetical protein
VVRAVRTCQNSSGQNGTCLGLLLLHIRPNGDGFGGQALHCLPCLFRQF